MVAEIKTGECSSINPCEGRDICQPSEVCLPKRIACFTEIHKCPQYTCGKYFIISDKSNHLY